MRLGETHAGNPGANSSPGTMQHVALRVKGDTELLAMRDRLRSKGVPVLGPIDHGFCKSIYFAGPENLALELSFSEEPIDARAWIEEQIRSREENNWAVDVDGHAAGCIGLSPRDDVNRQSAEIGFWLGEAYWGRGIMTEAVGAVTRYAFHTRGFVRVFAEVFEWNPASMRVLEKNGFTREGILRNSATKAGQVIDQVVYGTVAPPR